MSFVAILVALGLEQWRAFEWRAAVERSLIGQRQARWWRGSNPTCTR